MLMNELLLRRKSEKTNSRAHAQKIDNEIETFSHRKSLKVAQNPIHTSRGTFDFVWMFQIFQAQVAVLIGCYL